MENFVPVIFFVVLIILTIVLSTVGLYIVLVLKEVLKTLKRVNDTLEVVEKKVQNLVSPFQSFGGTIAGIKTGMKLFETFTAYLNKGSAKKKKS